MVLIISPMRILVRLVLNWKFFGIISRFGTTLSAIGSNLEYYLKSETEQYNSQYNCGFQCYRFHWKCYPPKNCHSGKLRIVGTNWNQNKSTIWICTARYREIWDLHFGKNWDLGQYFQKHWHKWTTWKSKCKSQISLYLAVQIQIVDLFWFQFVPRNLRFSFSKTKRQILLELSTQFMCDVTFFLSSFLTWLGWHMTHVSHDSCVTWLMCDMTHVRHDSCVTWLIGDTARVWHG